ncbi:hypothetical protein QTI66_24150 [Variovorax sp. J22R133]|uniref:hypothetical protein n=1 Tax=Variovorax brevis TaxID=3053503 RepID=UPI002574E00E|nr:hypothetical protein [Variovorax sp. J22R133]MDM0115264.1 hypothetical protein [Variovorax sp. J22R133]
MFGKLFGSAAAKQFGTEMALLLIERAENETKKHAQAKSIKKSEKRHEGTLLLIEKHLDQFKKINRLNILSKAQLGSAFKYTLLDNGYDQEFSDKTTTWLLLKCK